MEQLDSEQGFGIHSTSIESKRTVVDEESHSLFHSISWQRRKHVEVRYGKKHVFFIKKAGGAVEYTFGDRLGESLRDPDNHFHELFCRIPSASTEGKEHP